MERPHPPLHTVSYQANSSKSSSDADPSVPNAGLGRTFFEAEWIGMAHADAHGRLLRVNAGLCRITGYNEEELIGRTLFEITHPDDRERDRDGFLEFAAGGASTYQVDKRYVKKNGDAVWVQVIANLVRDGEGRPVGADALIQDIDARKEAEAAQTRALQTLRESERQQRMSAQVGELGARLRDVGELIEAIGRSVAAEFAVSRCGFAEIDLRHDLVTVTNDFHGDLPSLAGTYALSDYAGYYAEDGKAGRVVTVDDAATDPRTAAAYASRFAPIQLRSHLTVPLHRGGEWVAGWWITHHEPRHWTRSEIETMRLIAERAWAAIERKRAEDELRSSEQKFRSVLENMSEGVMLFDPEQNLIYQNPASLRIHGFAAAQDGRLSHEQVPATWDAWDEEDRPITFEEWPVSRVFRGERFQNQVLRVVRRETGQQFFGSYNGSPIRGAAGELQFGFITIRDITQQVTSNKALQENQRRLNAFFEAPILGAIYWNTSGAITDANDRFLAMVGYTREELTSGRVSWDEMTPPEFRAADEHALAELRDTGIDTPYEKEYIRKDGTRIPVLVGASMLDELRHDGVAFVLDVSARREAERALRESEHQFRALADSMPNLAWWADPTGAIMWYNQRWYDYTGATPEQMMGWGWQSVHHPTTLPQVVERWREALATSQIFEMEVPLRGANGEFRWFLTRVIPVRDASGAIVRWFGTNTDVSALREAREALARHKEQLEALVAQRTAELQGVVQELTTFSYSVSHDLRAPLRTITGFSDLLLSDFATSLPAEARGFLERIVKASRRMDSLITDVLEYSRVGRSELHFEVIDPEPLIRDIVEAHAASADGATVNVVGPFPAVYASKTALEQCLANLLTNAVKFTRPGVPSVVTIGAEARPHAVRVYVQDNGIGIAPEYRDRVWGLFERLNTSFTGTGLGLAIVRRAVERMGGQVGLESELGVGSKFWIELPAVPRV